jgi:hypothetical protein
MVVNLINVFLDEAKPPVFVLILRKQRAGKQRIVLYYMKKAGK